MYDITFSRTNAVAAAVGDDGTHFITIPLRIIPGDFKMDEIEIRLASVQRERLKRRGSEIKDLLPIDTKTRHARASDASDDGLVRLGDGFLTAIIIIYFRLSQAVPSVRVWQPRLDSTTVLSVTVHMT